MYDCGTPFNLSFVNDYSLLRTRKGVKPASFLDVIKNKSYDSVKNSYDRAIEHFISTKLPGT